MLLLIDGAINGTSLLAGRTMVSDSQKPAPQRVPDLYKLLALKPLENDSTLIRQALQRLAQRLKVAAEKPEATQDPAVLLRGKKLLELGQKHLLEPELKQRYDTQWREAYVERAKPDSRPDSVRNAANLQAANAAQQGKPQSEQRSSATAVVPLANPQWDLSELQSLLPLGEPTAALDLAEATEVETQWSSRLAAVMAFDGQFDQLRSQLSAAASATPVESEPKPASVAPPAGPSRPATEPTVPEAATDRTELAPIINLSQPLPSTVVPSISKRLRKKKERGLLWMAISALAGVGLVVGVAGWLLNPAKVEVAQLPNQAQLNSLTVPATASSNSAESNAPPRRSGLPQVQGLEPGTDLMANSSHFSQPPENFGDLPASAPSTGDAFDVAAVDASQTIDEAMAASMSELPMASAEPEPADSEPADGELTAAEQQQWKLGLLTARNLIADQQYSQAAEQLSASREMAKTVAQTAQLERWLTVNQLALELHDALQRAIAGLGPGETFMVGSSTTVSFVGFEDSRLALRVRGQSQAYQLTELPIGLVYGLTDLQMDRSHPRSLARKAAFALVHPAAQGNELAMSKSVEWMAEAIAAGAVADDMDQIFADSSDILKE